MITRTTGNRILAGARDVAIRTGLNRSEVCMAGGPDEAAAAGAGVVPAGWCRVCQPELPKVVRSK